MDLPIGLDGVLSIPRMSVLKKLLIMGVSCRQRVILRQVICRKLRMLSGLVMSFNISTAALQSGQRTWMISSLMLRGHVIISRPGISLMASSPMI